jgi:hypothetical protein
MGGEGMVHAYDRFAHMCGISTKSTCAHPRQAYACTCACIEQEIHTVQGWKNSGSRLRDILASGFGF